jgi:hypothetical protein
LTRRNTHGDRAFVYDELATGLHHFMGHYFEDLAPLCRPCHGLVHDTIRSSRHWSLIRDVAASQKVIERVRALRS